MTELKPIWGKVLYTPKGAALEYGRVGANFYTGCPHDCEYCYLKRGVTSKALGGTEVQLKKTLKDPDTAWDIFRKEAERHIDHLRQTGVFLSFSTDPLIPETQDLTISAIAFLNGRNVPTWVLTKNATFTESLHFQSSIIRGLEHKDIAHFGFTLTGRDDMEPKASTNLDRIETMRRLHEAGFKTFASIEPVIDWNSTDRVVIGSLDYCDHYKIGLRSGVKKDYYHPDEVFERIHRIVLTITSAARTVYLKESVRQVLRAVCSDEVYDRIMAETLDMDGKPWKKETTEQL